MRVGDLVVVDRDVMVFDEWGVGSRRVGDVRQGELCVVIGVVSQVCGWVGESYFVVRVVSSAGVMGWVSGGVRRVR